ncbi:MAG: hypothetical protein IPH11_15420 [Ignavibacteriales bacterium]|nr:hypothetical protein [Ignavibacteriales bacterium]
MPGYVLVEQKSLTPPRPSGQGVKANTQEIGFSDFLRELKQDEFPFNENSSLRVVGIEDVLLASRPNMDEFCRQIRNTLQSAGNYFFSKGCGDVQIVFRGELVRGAHLIVRHPTSDINIYLIFGSPAQEEINGQWIYKSSFNLSGN